MSQFIKSGSEEDRYLLAVVYSPSRLPLRGADGKTDLVSPRELEKACWRFAENGFRTGLNHKPGNPGACRVVESWIHRGKPWRVTGPDGTVTTVRKGTWLVGLVLDEPTWAAYKAGQFTGVSFQGETNRRPATTRALRRIKESA